jgi:FkbM family methyltransferase
MRGAPETTAPAAAGPRSFSLRRAPWFRRLKLFGKRLVGREPWLVPVPVPGLRVIDDWGCVPGLLAPGDRIYAFGVGTSAEFELALHRERGVQVDLFDPSPAAVRWVGTQSWPAALQFHPWAIASEDGTLRLVARGAQSGDEQVMYSAADPTRSGPVVEVEALTLASIRRRLGHGAVALVKLDVEGVEFDVLPGLLALDPLPRQVLVEFHHRFPGLGPDRARAAVAALRAAGYCLVWLSATGREFTFVRPD